MSTQTGQKNPIPGQNSTTLFKFVGERIREFRSQFGGTGVSQEFLAVKIGVATNTISRWETATYQPTLQNLEDLARFFGKSILEFFPNVSTSADEKLTALLRAAKGLANEDLEELKRYAEFRRARAAFADAKSTRNQKTDHE